MRYCSQVSSTAGVLRHTLSTFLLVRWQ
uniref:Uncharacterized protein n=1 Tax=Arundo donax TaxID=35708 RepID=A0A0A9GQ45_ARUDO